MPTNLWQINSPWGILRIYKDMEGGFFCDLVLADGYVVQSASNQTRPCQPVLPFPFIVEAGRFHQQAELLVPRIGRAVSRLPVRQVALFTFCLAGGIPAIELLESAPAIALLLALKIEKSAFSKPAGQTARLSCQKRHHILEFCSYPSRKWVVRLLKKIAPCQCCPYLLADLRTILTGGHNVKMRILRHLPKINRLVIEVLLNPGLSSRVHRKFYHSASNYPEKHGGIEVRYLLSEVVRFADDTHRTIPHIQSLADLQRVHDRHVEKTYRRFRDFLMGKSFRTPPLAQVLPSAKSRLKITPIQTGRELLLESIRMHHCIATYGEAIFYSNALYAYHVSSSTYEEATLVLNKIDNLWHIQEIRGPSNKVTEKSTINEVTAWLDAHNR